MSPHDSEPREPDAADGPTPDAAPSIAHVVVRVVRTGGFAGLRREWSAEPSASDTPRWIALIRSCPWDAVAVTAIPTGADRFVWSIHAEYGDDELAADLADRDVSGPWRELVDVVRGAAGS